MTVRMCARCAGGFHNDPDSHDTLPETHGDVGETCPTMYRE